MKPLDPAVLPHLAPARRALAGVVATGLVSGLLLVAQAFAVTGVVVGVLDGTGFREPALWLVVVTVARAVVAWLGDVLAASAATTVGTSLRRRVLAAALAEGPSALSRRKVGELAVLTTRGVAAVEPYLTRYLPTLVVAATLPPLTVLAIAWQDRLSALIVVLTLPLVPVFAVLIGKATQDRADRQWRLLSQLSGHFVDVVRGLPTLVAYGRAEAQSRTIRTVTHRYREATKETLKLGFASSAALELIATLSVALVAVTVGLRLATGSLDLGTALVVLLLAPEAYWPLRRVGAEFHAAAEGTATFAEVDGLVSGATTTTQPSEGPAPRLRTGLVVEGLTVRYPGRDTDVLRDLDLTVPPRGLTAVVGPSGGGKSTLLGVLTGDLRPRAGRVLVDGEELTADTVVAWQRHIAWVPQRPWLAAGSIADNVRLARPDATDAEVWAALERVALGEVVAAMPSGLGTELGEDGAGLSAGQRARLVLARAVVADRPLVLLDEPTAHLDAETEEVILETLQWLARRSSVVVVAHRPTVVELADHVVEVPLLSSARHETAVVAPQPAPVRPSTPPATGATTPTPESRPSARRLAGGMALGALASASGVALTATAGWLIARAAEQPPVLYLMVAIVSVRLFGLARPALRYAERLVSHDTALAMLAERRAAVFDRLVPLVPGRLTRQRGDLLTSVVDDVDSLLDRQLRVRTPVVTAVTVVALASLVSAWQLPVVGLLVLLSSALAGALAWWLARSGVGRAEPAYVGARSDLSAHVVATLQGAGDLVLWQAVGRRLDELDRIGGVASAATRSSARTVAAGRALVTLLTGLAMVAVAGLAAPAVRAGELSGPMFALLLLLPLALAEVLTPLADAGALSVRTRAAEARIARLDAETPAVISPAEPVSTDLRSPALAAYDVSAGWGAEPAFTGVSFDLEPGARLGVVGPSGCGKSTLAAVLLRFLDPVTGRVELAGTPLPRLDLGDVRGTVGLVDDDPHVFGSTLRENLRLARPTAGDDELHEALRATAMDRWVAALPLGLDTRLGDGGAHVSGGERARLGLARAVLADRQVLVLDEPTAHLDTATATEVTTDLLDGAAGRRRTVVWITHGTVGLDRMDWVLDISAARLSEAPVRA